MSKHAVWFNRYWTWFDEFDDEDARPLNAEEGDESYGWWALIPCEEGFVPVNGTVVRQEVEG